MAKTDEVKHRFSMPFGLFYMGLTDTIQDQKSFKQVAMQIGLGYKKTRSFQ
jgi:hypothetical protein